MMKITIIAAYFGKLPNYFHLFLESCEFNPEFSWLIFTDDKTQYNYPENVSPVFVSFENIQERIKQNIGNYAICHKPYKLCDYKPAYGLIFQDYLQKSDYWGHCDLDVIWGDLYKFLKEPLTKQYDRILGYGHLSLYKNNEKVNHYFKLPFSGINYKYVFTHKLSFGFDEKRGMNKLMAENGIDFWHKEIKFDIQRPIDSLILKTYNWTNYFNQKFVFNNGKVHRFFSVNSEIISEEVAYIHLQQRKIKVNIDDFSKFKICNESIEELDAKKCLNFNLHPKTLLKEQRKKYLRNSFVYKIHRIMNCLKI